MKNLTQLGKLTRNGYRRSKGYVSSDDGLLVQKHFWLGHDLVAAIEKIELIEQQAQAPTSVDERLLWSPEQIEFLESEFAVIDTRHARVPQGA